MNKPILSLFIASSSLFTDPALGQEITAPLEEICPQPSTVVPFGDVGFTDMSGRGQLVEFAGTGVKVCTGEDKVVIRDLNEVTIACNDILTGEGGGIQHNFFVGTDQFHFWLYINPEPENGTRMLEYGVYRHANGEETRMLWLVTGAPICN